MYPQILPINRPKLINVWANYPLPPWTITHWHFPPMNCQLCYFAPMNYHFVPKNPFRQSKSLTQTVNLSLCITLPHELQCIVTLPPWTTTYCHFAPMNYNALSLWLFELMALTDGKGFWAQNGSSWGQSSIIGSSWGKKVVSPQCFSFKNYYLSHVLQFGRERKSVIGKFMGNDQLQQNECRQVITFDDLFL